MSALVASRAVRFSPAPKAMAPVKARGKDPVVALVHQHRLLAQEWQRQIAEIDRKFIRHRLPRRPRVDALWWCVRGHAPRWVSNVFELQQVLPMGLKASPNGRRLVRVDDPHFAETARRLLEATAAWNRRMEATGITKRQVDAYHTRRRLDALAARIVRTPATSIVGVAMKLEWVGALHGRDIETLPAPPTDAEIADDIAAAALVSAVLDAAALAAGELALETRRRAV